MSSPKIDLYDTTLRDGMQGLGMSLSAAEKVRVVRALDKLGVGFIEAGFPSSNPKEIELFEMLAEVDLDNADVAAFGMTRRRGVTAEEDEGLRVLVDCFAPVSTIVGKTWALHLEKVTKVSRDENLEMISESVAFLVANGKRVIYDAENFFDAWPEDQAYALACLEAAVAAGAWNITLCDTRGATLPGAVAAATATVVEALGDRAKVGVHTHNDAECGVANSLAGVEAGATMVQGTINGIGERTGNANLVSILPALQLKMGYDVVDPAQLELLTETSHLVSELLNVIPDAAQPYVGRNAFAHKGGLHVAGIQSDARTFEHLEPELVGNQRQVVISELSGKGSVLSLARDAGIEMDDSRAREVVERVKQREHEGYHYEAAEASFELLLLREADDYEPLFRFESFRVVTEKRASGKVETEATIKIWVGDQRHVCTAEGNGPVNALDAALRQAIGDLYPQLNNVELIDYKVRILDTHHGTGAVTRVLLDSTDGQETWGTIGVSENIIEASWEALVESLEYAFQPSRKGSGAEKKVSDPA